MRNIRIIALIFLFGMYQKTRSARILFATLPARSHFNEIDGIAQTLKERDHEVFIFASKFFEDVVKRKGYGVITLDDPDFQDADFLIRRFQFGKQFWRMMFDPETRDIVAKAFNSVSTPAVINKVKQLNFDLVIIDMISVAMNAYAVAHELKIPYITSSSQLPFFMLRTNALSFQRPHMMTAALLHVNNGLFSRGTNIVLSILFDVVLPNIAPHHQMLINKIQPLTLDEMVFQSKAHFLHQIPELDLSCPLMPNTFSVGGSTVAKSSQSNIPDDLASFIDEGTPDGMILMSLGSTIPFLPRHIAEKFAEAFRQLPYKFILRDSGKSGVIYPKNVMVMKWLPQRALLSHKKIKLFITHGGNNGQMEAFASGVPMITMATAFDQQYCSLRSVIKGYGVAVDFFDFQPLELVEAVKEVVANATYREHIQRDARTWWHRGIPANTVAADVVDAVLRQETDHLTAAEHQSLNLIQFYMVDCVGLIMAVMCVACVMVFLALKYLLK